jgi:hypothetical protein
VADEIQPFTPGDGHTPSPKVHLRTFVVQPRTALGKFALAAALVGAGVLFFTVGLALALGLAAAAAVTGIVVVGYRAITGKTASPLAPPRAPSTPRLDPSKEIFLPKTDDRDP